MHSLRDHFRVTTEEELGPERNQDAQRELNVFQTLALITVPALAVHAGAATFIGYLLGAFE